MTNAKTKAFVIEALGNMAPIIGADRLEAVIPKLLPTLLAPYKSGSFFLKNV